MVEGADWLCQKHFGKTLIDRDVEILDPATGTGTFICELIEHFRGQPAKLRAQVQEELHANEVAILPYYVANLNIEATYAAVTGEYAEFENLCFVDTLDNTAGLGIKAGHQFDMFGGALATRTSSGCSAQNKRKISVVIGNPPYNANQQNENDNNKNRAYPHIDGLIKRSFVRLSTAQKTKVYDMYARFFRWASDRLHDDGVIAFVTNRSFIDSRTFDGFRRYVAQEFAEVYRGRPRRATCGRTRGSRAPSTTSSASRPGWRSRSCVKKRGREGLPHPLRAAAGDWTPPRTSSPGWGRTRASGLAFERVVPDKRANWINQNENDWDELIPVADKKTKAAKMRVAGAGDLQAVSRLGSSPIATSGSMISTAQPGKKIERFVAAHTRQIDVQSAAEAPRRQRLGRRASSGRDRIRVTSGRGERRFSTKSMVHASAYRLFCQVRCISINVDDS